MKIVLINPPAFNEITTQVSRFISEKSSLQPPLGLMYIAAVAIKGGLSDVSIIDCQAEKLSYNELESRIAQEKPDLVGMTAMTFTMTDVIFTARIIKKTSPCAKIVLGGPHIDIYPYETINLPEIDYVIKKEGEYPFLELSTKLNKGLNEDLHNIDNLIWKNCDGEIITNKTSENVNDYSSMPFPSRELIPIEKYFSIATDNNPITTLITAKGCPYQCIFCYKHIKKVSYRSSSNIVDEMEYIKKMGIKEIFFVDDTFYVNSKRAIAICDEIIERKLNIPWGARARVNNISEEMLLKFKKAGCRRLHIGVESGNDKILANLNKKITVKMIKRAFSLCKKHKMETMAYFIIGSPGETEKEVHDTINLAKQIKPTFAQFSRMTPFPATKLYEMALEQNIISHDYWQEYALNPAKPVEPQFWTEHFTQEQLSDMADYATKNFYIRPVYMIRSALRLRSFSDFKRKIKVGFSLIRANSFHKSIKLKMT